MARLNRQGAMVPSWRRPTMRVDVSQCLYGCWPIARPVAHGRSAEPCWARPTLSSRKISLAVKDTDVPRGLGQLAYGTLRILPTGCPGLH